MSLTQLVGMSDVAARLKALRPGVPRKIDAPLQVEPRSNRYSMVGTAFDYLLRFELHRRAPHAVAERWIAERAPNMLCAETHDGIAVLREDLSGACHLSPEEASRRTRAIIENAKTAFAAYIKMKTPKPTKLVNLAAHAIRLANLDEVVRASHPLDPEFEAAAPEDVEDLLAMLAIVPFDSLLQSEAISLNPRFGQSSEMVGGADADLIAGDVLADFKVTKKCVVTTRHLDQLLGYYLLARNQRRLDGEFPEIRRAALYFCRHGYLWVLDASAWLVNPQFVQIEKWFVAHAKEVFGPSRIARMTGASLQNTS